MIKINYVFDICINTSIKGGIIIILILFLRHLFRNDFTARWTYGLWILALVRLLIPFSPIKNTFSLFNLGLVKRIQFNINEILLGRLGTASDHFKIINEDVSIDSFISNVFSFDFKDLIVIIWLLGIFIFTIILILINININKILKNSYQYKDTDLLNILNTCREKIDFKKTPILYISSHVSTPLTCRVLHPKIIIPESTLIKLKIDDLENIFLHELVHIKRRDILYNNVAMVLCIIHWFNPLVWYAFVRSKKDCELACDESVLNYLTPKEHTTYGLTLIKMIEYASNERTPSPFLSKALINDRSEANDRVLHITTFHQKRKVIILTSMVLLFIISFIGLNDSSSTRPAIISRQYNLSDYIHSTEHTIRHSFGAYPKHTFALKTNKSSYFILYYNILGEKVQFWYDGSDGSQKRKTLEITTTSFKGIKQGMSIEDLMKIADSVSLQLIDFQKTNSLTRYIYKDIDCNIMVVNDNKTNKIYSLTLY